MIDIHDAGLTFPREFSPVGPISRIVLHHVAGSMTVRAIHQMHVNKGWNGIAYHYYIGKTGEVWRGRPETALGAGVDGANYGSIHVVFDGNFEQETMSRAQLRAGEQLVIELLKKFPQAAVVGHRDVGASSCPGVNFPLTTFKQLATGKAIYDALMIYTQALGVDDYARYSCQRGVEVGIFKDGDGDGLTDWPKAFITRQDVAVLLDRMGAFGE